MLALYWAYALLCDMTTFLCVEGKPPGIVLSMQVCTLLCGVMCCSVCSAKCTLMQITSASASKHVLRTSFIQNLVTKLVAWTPHIRCKEGRPSCIVAYRQLLRTSCADMHVAHLYECLRRVEGERHMLLQHCSFFPALRQNVQGQDCILTRLYSAYQLPIVFFSCSTLDSCVLQNQEE